MRRLVAIMLIGLLVIGCSGMHASLGYYNDDYYLRPHHLDYGNPYFLDPFYYDDCPRYYELRPLNCGACHFVY